MILARSVRFARALRTQRNVTQTEAFLAGRCAALGVGADSRLTSGVSTCTGIRWI